MENYRNEDRTDNKYGIPYSPPVGKNLNEPIQIRDPKSWHEQKGKHLCKKLFSKQLQQDVKSFPLSKDAPEPDFWSGRGLFIYGETGVGKTVLAANILMDVKKHLWINFQNKFQNKECRFTSMPRLFQRLKKSYDSEISQETEWDIMEEQEDTWLLVLDDLGVSGKPSDWLIEKLYLLIDQRWQSMKPTIITSNFDLNKLSKVLEGDRITSRIDRMCSIAKKKPFG